MPLNGMEGLEGCSQWNSMGRAVDTVFEGKRKRSPTTRTRAVLIADMMILEGEAAPSSPRANARP